MLAWYYIHDTTGTKCKAVLASRSGHSGRCYVHVCFDPFPFADSESLFVTVTSTIDTCTASKLTTSINRMSCILKLLLCGGYDATIMLLPFYSSSSSLRCIKIIRHQTRTFWLSLGYSFTVAGRKRLIANLECQAAY